MLRLWPLTAWPLRLLLLLALPRLLPNQQPPLIAESSPPFGVSRASTSATGLQHLRKNPLLEILNLPDSLQHQNAWVCSHAPRPCIESVFSRAAGHLIATPRTSSSCLDFGGSWKTALPKPSCVFEHRRTIVRKGWNCCRGGLLPRLHRPPHNALRRCGNFPCICAPVSSSPLTFSSFSATLCGDTRIIQHLPAGPYTPAGSPLQVTSTLTRCHDTRKRNRRVCFLCVSPDSRCTSPLVRASCKARRQASLLVRSAHTGSLFETWRRHEPSALCCYRSRTLAASLLQKPELKICYIASGGKPFSVATAAATFNRTLAPKVFHAASSASTTLIAVTGSSAARHKCQLSAAGTSPSLIALCGKRCLVAASSERGGTTKSLVAFDAAPSQQAASGACPGGSMLSTFGTATPLFPARALQAVSPEAPSTPPPKQRRFLSSFPETPTSLETVSYPFSSIEKKWARYYAEHPEDYSPPLPGNDWTFREQVSSAELPSVYSSVQAPSGTCVTAASHLAATALPSSARATKDSSDSPRACSDIKVRQAVLAAAPDDTDMRATSHTKLLQSSNSLSFDRRAAVGTAPPYARGRKKGADGDTIVSASSRSTRAVHAGGKLVNLANSRSASDPMSSTGRFRTAALLSHHDCRQVNASSHLRQHEDVCGHTSDCGCCTSSKCGDESPVYAPMVEQIHRDLKQTSDLAGTQRQPEEATPSAAKAAASAPSTGQVKKGNKFYILSMIPYPSGEGLHVGHCFTYTVADVVARYKRLQLRGELLRDEMRIEERRMSEGISVERGKGDLVQQQGHNQGDQTALKPQRHLQTGTSTLELLRMPARENNFGETQNEGRSAFSSIEQLKCGSPEQGTIRQGSVKNEEPALPSVRRRVVARVLDNGSRQEGVWSGPSFTGSIPTASGQNERGSVTPNRPGKEDQQALSRALPQPDVMHVMGWDAFGLPAEQHALVSGLSPRLSVCKNVERFRRQLQRLGLCVDWRREINTSDPKYFRWTQWIFLQMWKRGLVYEKAANVNWCEALGTVLADEEVVNGVSNRGHHPVEQRCLEQWHLRITAYADELLKSLDLLDWPEDIKVMQRNWIGRRDLLYVNLPLLSSSPADENILSTPEGENLKGQATVERTSGLEPVSREKLQCGSSSACGAAINENSSSPGNQPSCPITVLPAQLCRMATNAAAELCPREYGGTIGQDDGKSSTLRCVCVSPEFLFGVTFVGMHAAHKQARAAAVAPAARRWLARQNCMPSADGADQKRRSTSLLHVESDGLHTSEQRSCSTSDSSAENLAEADTMKELVLDATGEGKGQANIARNTHRVRKVSEPSSSFVSRESMFSGSYLKHPLTEAALPVWLLSGKLFDQLKGAGTYFNQYDAVLLVPGQDRIAEQLAHAAGVPVVQMLATTTPDEIKTGTFAQKTIIPDSTETVRPQYKKEVVPAKAVNSWLRDILINSESGKVTVNGLTRGQARQRILEHLVTRGIGEQHSGFALRDWVFSRQRFWGEPIPLIRAHALKDGRSSVFAESEAHLPVTLPEEMFGRRVTFQRSSGSQDYRVAQRVARCFTSGERTYKQDALPVEPERKLYDRFTFAENKGNSRLPHSSRMAPLAQYPQWWDITHRYDVEIPRLQRSIHRTCKDARGPVIGRQAEKTEEQRTRVSLQREVSTMPQWAGSSWYFLRFLDPHNRQEAFNKGVAQYWMPVDLYVGGKEHAVTHLLYARFWHKVLRDLGCVACGEPFRRLCTPGIILGTPRYVAFQRLDTGEWVPASSVSFRKNGNPSECDLLSNRSNCSSSTKQEIRPEITRTDNTHQSLRPTHTQQDFLDASCCRAENGSATNTQFSTPMSETADTDQSTCMAVVRQDTVAGLHIPSGQPVREVVVEKAAILHVKESGVPVLKENGDVDVVCRYEKMSKSRGNVVSPDSLIDAYGADALRLHLLFMGPIEARKIWSLGGIKGISRFLNRVWHLITSGRKTEIRPAGEGTVYRTKSSSPSLPDKGPLSSSESIGGIDMNGFARGAGEHAASATNSDESVTVAWPEADLATRCPPKSESCQLQNCSFSVFEKTLLIQLVDRVTRHIERMAFNSALAALMCAVRKLSQWKAEGNLLSVHGALILVKLLHPFAPFITEEIWFRIHECFPNVSKCGSNPSLLACGVWPSREDLGVNTCDRASDGSSEARKRHTRTSVEPGVESTVSVGVYLDGKLRVRMHVPAGYMNDKSALEGYVRRSVQVSNLLEKRKVLRSVVVPKATLINFVTQHINFSGEASEEMRD